MIPLSKPIKLIEKKGAKGVFEVEALYPGYGVTVGNSLRRVLLSSLEGAAVVQVKFKGISHEFSTIPGVLEDVISIILNLKKMRFKMYSDEPQKATLKIKGEKEIKGKDFKFSPHVELINQDTPIAHLTSKTAELEMEIEIDKGIGYVLAESRKRGKEEIGTISLDATFTPVRRVSYKVSQMRVGERTDFDKLIIEVETDGTVEPEEAMQKATETLVRQFEIIENGLKAMIPAVKPAVKESAVKKPTVKKVVKKKAVSKKKAK